MKLNWKKSNNSIWKQIIKKILMKQNTLKCWECSSVTSVASAFYTNCCNRCVCNTCFVMHQCSFIMGEKDIQQQCQRCGLTKGTIECKQCSVAALCVECDKKIHQTEKFEKHDRKKSELTKILFEENNPYLLTKSMKNQYQQRNDQYNKLVLIGISQTWSQVFTDVQEKFDELLDQLEDKKKQILNKIQKRKEKQIKIYEETFSQFVDARNKNILDGNLRKSQILDKLENAKKKLESFQCQYTITPDRKKKMSVTNSQFDSIKGLIQCLELKGLIIKIVNSQPPKPKMRNSMVFASPAAKDPEFSKISRNTKPKMSLSTIENEFKENFEKPNEEDDRVRASLKIQKIKSDRNFKKDLTNLKLCFKNKTKK